MHTLYSIKDEHTLPPRLPDGTIVADSLETNEALDAYPESPLVLFMVAKPL